MPALSRFTRASAASSVVRRAAFSLVVLSVLSVPAEAQLGGLAKKAKDRVAGEATRKANSSPSLNGEAVAFDDVILELNDARLAQVLKGLQAGQQAQNAPGGRRQLAMRRDSLHNQYAALSSAHGNAIDAHNQKANGISRCRHQALRQVSETRQNDFNQRVQSDPALQRKVMDMTMRASESMAKGDSATYKALEAEARALTSPTAADSAIVDKQCGAEPPKHPKEVELEGIQARIRQLDDQIRDAEQAITAAEAQASGMTSRQFAMARERIEMYLSRAKSNSPQKGFTTAELQALNAAQSQLQGAM